MTQNTPQQQKAPTDTAHTFDVGVFVVRVLVNGTARVEFMGVEVAKAENELAAQRDAGRRMLARAAKAANLAPVAA